MRGVLSSYSSRGRSPTGLLKNGIPGGTRRCSYQGSLGFALRVDVGEVGGKVDVSGACDVEDDAPPTTAFPRSSSSPRVTPGDARLESPLASKAGVSSLSITSTSCEY